jgi:2Fe-2S ferredoxin
MTKIVVLPNESLCPDGIVIEALPGENICRALLRNHI